MPKKIENPFISYVSSLSTDDLSQLVEAIDIRIDKDKYDFTSLEEAAIFYNREPKCPNCGSNRYIKEGRTNAGHTRYRCRVCDDTYTLLADSIFNSAKNLIA